jgi:hypothetical protein
VDYLIQEREMVAKLVFSLGDIQQIGAEYLRDKKI